MATQQKNSGYSLVELMIAIAIGMAVMSGVVTTFTGSMKASTATMRIAQFDQELRAVMGVMTRDIRRAGYDSAVQADALTGISTNPFMENERLSIWKTIAGGAVAVVDAETGVTDFGPCITYAYDVALDGVANPGDRKGFRKNGSVIEKISGGNATPADCSTAGENLTSNDVTITNLRFEYLDYTNTGDVAADTIVSRVVRVTLEASSAQDGTIRRKLVDDIKISNNFYRE